VKLRQRVIAHGEIGRRQFQPRGGVGGFEVDQAFQRGGGGLVIAQLDRQLRILRHERPVGGRVEHAREDRGALRLQRRRRCASAVWRGRVMRQRKAKRQRTRPAFRRVFAYHHAPTWNRPKAMNEVEP
jgi:hypothetical protein